MGCGESAADVVEARDLRIASVAFVLSAIIFDQHKDWFGRIK